MKRAESAADATTFPTTVQETTSSFPRQHFHHCVDQGRTDGSRVWSRGDTIGSCCRISEQEEQTRLGKRWNILNSLNPHAVFGGQRPTMTCRTKLPVCSVVRCGGKAILPLVESISILNAICFRFVTAIIFSKEVAPRPSRKIKI